MISCIDSRGMLILIHDLLLSISLMNGQCLIAKGGEIAAVIIPVSVDKWIEKIHS